MPEFTPPAPRADLLWAGIDLDGTLATSLWSPDNPNAQIGEMIWDNVHKAIALHDQGYKLWIHTARPSSDYEQIEYWCNYHGIPIKGIITGKPLFAVYIDDRNVSPQAPDWSDPSSEFSAAWNQGYSKALEDEASRNSRNGW